MGGEQWVGGGAAAAGSAGPGWDRCGSGASVKRGLQPEGEESGGTAEWCGSAW